jgi:aryl-alcohol dehydrogenase-like predicted oxidoreductase
MDVADQAGINFFDTANVYPFEAGIENVGMTEEIIGNWLRERKARDRIVLATKCYSKIGPGPNDEGLSRRHILAACEQSLRRLKTDDLVHAGKVRYIGCSNFPAWRLADALWTSKLLNLARFESVQPRYNMLFRMIEDELIPLSQAHNVGVLVYNPLAAGVLTGRYRQARTLEQNTRFTLKTSGEMYQRRYWRDPMFEAVDRLASVVEPRGKKLVEVALAWVLAQPGITCAILGASKLEQFTESLRGATVSLDEEERKICDDLWYTMPRERDPLLARR